MFPARRNPRMAAYDACRPPHQLLLLLKRSNEWAVKAVSPWAGPLVVASSRSRSRVPSTRGYFSEFLESVRAGFAAGGDEGRGAHFRIGAGGGWGVNAQTKIPGYEADRPFRIPSPAHDSCRTARHGALHQGIMHERQQSTVVGARASEAKGRGFSSALLRPCLEHRGSILIPVLLTKKHKTTV